MSKGKIVLRLLIGLPIQTLVFLCLVFIYSTLVIGQNQFFEFSYVSINYNHTHYVMALFIFCVIVSRIIVKLPSHRVMLFFPIFILNYSLGAISRILISGTSL